MDSAIQELLVAAVSNGLTEFVVRAIDEPAGVAVVERIDDAVSQAIAQLTDVDAIHEHLGGERLREFLCSQEIRHVIRQIYASAGTSKTLESIEVEFRELWRSRTGITDEEIQEDVDRLFRALVSLCEGALDCAISAGCLSAADAKAARRHRELRGAVEGVQRVVDVLGQSPQPDIALIDDYVAKYRRQVATREGYITPPALDSARQVPIDSLYVPGQLSQAGPESADTVTYTDFRRKLFRSVVLGNPGSGKSTLAKKLTTDLARDQSELSIRASPLVPFLIVLRDFGAHKKDHPCSVVDFMSALSNSRYQVQAPSNAIEYLLSTGRAVVIFDGLDELLDTSYRAEISGDVASFAALYPSVPILVTSREVGYMQAPLPDAMFDTYKLASFTDQQVQQYAENWFRVSDSSNPESAEDEAASFMSDSSNVTDLRSNALMLGLMCNLYKGSGYIPRNRPEVYEACAEMLFDRWDRLRKIGEPLSIESLLRPTMQYLASWIYADGELQSGVTEKQLIAEATKYLLGRRYDDPDEAKLEATNFIEFCRGRAWVFTDTGTTPAGESIYQFTHRTFLEFFTAGHLVRTNATAHKLLAVLERHIIDREWDVVAQLAFQLLDRNVDGSGNELLEELLRDRGDLLEQGESNRINFAVRSLEFLVPAPSVTRMVASRALAHVVDVLEPRLEDSPAEIKHDGTVDTAVGNVLDLMRANPENAAPIRESLVDSAAVHLSGSKASPLVAEVMLGLRRGAKPDNLARSVGSALMERSGPELFKLAEADEGLAADLVLEAHMSAVDFIGHHGVEAFLTHRWFRVFPASERVSLAEISLASILWSGQWGLSLEEAESALTAMKPRLSDRELPWHTARTQHTGWLFIGAPSGEFVPRKVSAGDLDPDVRFSFIALACAFWEETLAANEQGVQSGFGNSQSVGELNGPASSLWQSLLPILAARRELSPNLEAISALELPPDSKDLIVRWAQGEVSLVRMVAPNKRAT